MKISRENYETILVDYLDGKLSPEDEAELMLFLIKNTDIAEEFEGLKDIALTPSAMQFPNKLTLKKHQYQPMGFDNEIEYLCIADLEGDLTSEEESKLKKLSASDESIRNIKTLFSNTKLTVPHEIVYPYKSNIKRLLVIPIRRSSFRIIMATVASVALMLGVYSALDLKKTFETVAVNQPKAIQQDLTPPNTNSPKKNQSSSNMSANKNAIISPKGDIIIRKTKAIIEKQTLETIKALPPKFSNVAQVSPTKLLLPNLSPSNTTIAKEPLQENILAYGSTKEYTLADIAKQGLKKVANALGVEYEVKKSNNGKLKKLSIESNLLAFSTTKNKNDE